MYKNQRLTFINKGGIFSYLAIFILSNLLKKYAAMARCLKIPLYIIRRATAQLRGGERSIYGKMLQNFSLRGLFSCVFDEKFIKVP